MPPKGLPALKERLTLAQLASYDDVITDALVDHVTTTPLKVPSPPVAPGLRAFHADSPCALQVYYWSTIRKNRTKFVPSRGIREEDVADILRESAIVDKDPAKAEERLLRLAGIRKFMERLKTEKEKEDFCKHLRKYLNIWLPDCPFEVSTTNRYTILTHEAAITARKVIPKGITIKYLSGIQVTMTKDEEADLDLRRRDFSIVMSSRKKSTSLFLGPARFANHDCDANARLVTSGPRGMSVATVREIDIGEEITVSYGADYFGEENCECLCKTCESYKRNGWASVNSASRTVTPVDSDQTQEAPYSFRRKRRYESERSSVALSITPETLTPVTTPMKKRRVSDRHIKMERQSSQLSNEAPSYDLPRRQPRNIATAAAAVGGSRAIGVRRLASVQNGVTKGPKNTIIAMPTLRQTRSRKNTLQIPQITLDGELEVSPLKTETILDTVEKPASSDAGDSSPSSSGMDDSRISSSSSTDATSIFDESITTESSSMKTRKKRPIISEDTIIVTLVANVPAIDITAANASVKHSSTTECSRSTTSNKAKAKNSRLSRDKALPTTDTDSPIHSPKLRIPGDYRTSSAVLFDCAAWVECTVCDESFIQPDAYFLRSACPRCERHSKLYGYQWPKTEKAGKGDKEERVTDHRTVHRFIRPQEEKDRRKDRRLSRELSMASSAVLNTESDSTRDDQQAGKRRGNMRWRRITT
ncbi:MAG: Histone-lysine N-methyltransferase set9 [Geoglossum simile]|nr:MAG: Histone-lysine N-methyltransferase set9 [Geoglossum simile]